MTWEGRHHSNSLDSFDQNIVDYFFQSRKTEIKNYM